MGPTFWAFSSLHRRPGKKFFFPGAIEVPFKPGKELIQSLSLQVCLIGKVSVWGWLENVSWYTLATSVCPGSANELERMMPDVPPLISERTWCSDSGSELQVLGVSAGADLDYVSVSLNSPGSVGAISSLSTFGSGPWETNSFLMLFYSKWE